MQSLIVWDPKRGKKRDQIIAGATKVFAEKGFHQATMDEIAKAAGVGKGTLYYYASSKRALFFFLFEATIEKAEKEVFAKVSQEDSVTARLKSLIYHHLKFVYGQGKEIARIIMEMGGPEQEFLGRVSGVWERYIGFVAGILEKGKKEKVIKPGLDSQVAARALLATVVFTAWQLALQGEKVSLDKTAETISEIYLTGVTMS